MSDDKPPWAAHTRPAFHEWMWDTHPDNVDDWIATDDETGVEVQVCVGSLVEVHVQGGDCQVTIALEPEEDIAQAIIRGWRALHIAHGDKDPQPDTARSRP